MTLHDAGAEVTVTAPPADQVANPPKPGE